MEKSEVVKGNKKKLQSENKKIDGRIRLKYDSNHKKCRVNGMKQTPNKNRGALHGPMMLMSIR